MRIAKPIALICWGSEVDQTFLWAVWRLGSLCKYQCLGTIHLCLRILATAVSSSLMFRAWGLSKEISYPEELTRPPCAMHSKHTEVLGSCHSIAVLMVHLTPALLCMRLSVCLSVMSSFLCLLSQIPGTKTSWDMINVYCLPLFFSEEEMEAKTDQVACSMLDINNDGHGH